MKSAIHYVVKAKLIRSKTTEGFDFLEFEEKFECENAIQARETAFNFYQNYIDVLMESRGKEYESDNQAREELKSFLEAETSPKLEGLGMGIYCYVDDPIENLKNINGENCLIHGIGNLSGGKYDSDIAILNLFNEFNCYQLLKYETGNRRKVVVYCMQDDSPVEYWKEKPDTYEILETPFDWSLYIRPKMLCHDMPLDDIELT